MNTRKLTQAAVIAALYAALTILAAAIPTVGTFMFGPFQVRIAEALTILPYFTTAAIPGLAVGCLISNLAGMAFGLGGGILDVIFGTLATLAAAWLSSRAKKPWLVPLPPVALNAFIVAGVLAFTSHALLALGALHRRRAGRRLLWPGLSPAASAAPLSPPLWPPIGPDHYISPKGAGSGFFFCASALPAS